MEHTLSLTSTKDGKNGKKTEHVDVNRLKIPRFDILFRLKSCVELFLGQRFENVHFYYKEHKMKLDSIKFDSCILKIS